jgi:hypothetical protein
MRRAIVVLLALAGFGLPVAFDPLGLSASPGAPVITDPADDATGVVVESTPAPSEPSLDILAADIEVTATTITTSIDVKALVATPPPGSTGRFYRWYFTHAGLVFLVQALQQASGETAELDDPTGSVACASCAADFDEAANRITMTVPLDLVNERVAALGSGDIPPIGPGVELYQLNVLSQRYVGAVTPTADSAGTDLPYLVPGASPPPPPPDGGTGPDEVGDATVVAVVDSNIVPYHWDFAADHMPNSLPLDRAPHEWLSGFPSPSTFAGYHALDLTLDGTNPKAEIAELDAADAAVWDGVQGSTPDAVNYYWMPGTKIIGAIEFGAGKLHGTTEDHGVGVTSVAVGNLHGGCPECVLVFLNSDSNEGSLAALKWAMQQPWIDVITNSYGVNLVGGYVRDNVYLGHEVLDAGRTATERGQTTFFSAGNGLANAFDLPTSTYTSSVKGPDWIVTVGAASPPPGREDFSGSGKPVDLAGIGVDYPSAYTATHVSGTGPTGFSGTSNATPTVAGTYARAIYKARRDLAGPSRSQSGDVIARAVSTVPLTPPPAYTCGPARPLCELHDGRLTGVELRTRLLQGAQHAFADTTVAGLQSVPKVADEEFASTGHGLYVVRQQRTPSLWEAEFDRVLGPLEGRAPVAARPAGEKEWMTVDSFCRQRLWGAWPGGLYKEGDPVPPADPAWPIRSVISTGCAPLPPWPDAGITLSP